MRKAALPRIAATLLLSLAAGCGSERAAAPRTDVAAVARARADGAGPVQVPADIAAFYQARSYRPLWAAGGRLRPEARAVAAMVAEARADGLDPERYEARRLAAALAAAAGGAKADLARAELLLSKAYADFLFDLRNPVAARGTFYVDAELEPEVPDRRALLEAAARAPSLRAHLAEARQMNPVYEGLRGGLERQRKAGMTAEQERIAFLNLERARALPRDPGRRFIFVDTASARLWMFENGRIRDRMRAIVGKRGMETPVMAGLIRYAVLTPYWNVPPDLARTGIARRVLREGPAYLARERMQVLSDWSDAARPIPASAVDWRAVAAGRQDLRVRELPGPGNMMGEVKFMMPNRLGIYLHDTPNKASFLEAERRLSSGCVRVQDAQRLSRWLFGGEAPRPSGRPEQQVDLPEPVPVFISYLTALPSPDGLVFTRDAYARDAALLAELKRRGRLL